MGKWTQNLFLIFSCLAVLGGVLPDAAAHRRIDGALPRSSPLKSLASQADQGQTVQPPPFSPEAYWRRVEMLAKADKPAELQETVLALVNLFPQAPQRGAACLTLAHQAKDQGESAKALELYGLATALGRGTPLEGQARLSTAFLELALDLSSRDPAQALRSFLEKTAALPGDFPQESRRHAFRDGWQMVGRHVQRLEPCPLPLLEELLTLWELQPEGVRPEEGALLLADLLKKHGLFEQAHNFVRKAGNYDGGPDPVSFSSRSLELIWLSRGWVGMAEFLKRSPGKEGEASELLCSWIAAQQGKGPIFCPPAGEGGNPGDALLAWFLPREAHAAHPDRLVPALKQALQHSWPAFLEERLQNELAWNYLSQGNFSLAARTYQEMVVRSVIPEGVPFYQDRLGLSRWREGLMDAAQAAFHTLERDSDPFWQSLAKARLADLELASIQRPSSP